MRAYLLLSFIMPLTHLLAGAVSPETSPTATCIYWNKDRGYAPFKYATPSGVEIHNQTSYDISDAITFPMPSDNFSLQFRAANLSADPSRRSSHSTTDGKTSSRYMPEWGFFLVSAAGDTTSFTIQSVEHADPFSSSAALKIKTSRNGFIIQETIKSDGLNPYDGKNTWKINVSPRNIGILAGKSELASVIDISGNYHKFSSFGFLSSPAAHLKASDIAFCADKAPDLAPHPVWSNNETLSHHFSSSTDPLEGWWVMFDRALDESLLQPGGDYRLAIVKDGKDYLILYISGAIKNASAWRPGTVKGILSPDPFPGVYSLTWIDAEGNPLHNGVKAQEGDGSTLSLQFPYHSSTLRLRKLPADYP